MEKFASNISPITLTSIVGVIREPPSATIYISARISVNIDMTKPMINELNI
jgi:hypothetical protein